MTYNRNKKGEINNRKQVNYNPWHFIHFYICIYMRKWEWRWGRRPWEKRKRNTKTGGKIERGEEIDAQIQLTHRERKRTAYNRITWVNEHQTIFLFGWLHSFVSHWLLCHRMQIVTTELQWKVKGMRKKLTESM